MVLVSVALVSSCRFCRVSGAGCPEGLVPASRAALPVLTAFFCGVGTGRGGCDLFSRDTTGALRAREGGSGGTSADITIGSSIETFDIGSSATQDPLLHDAHGHDRTPLTGMRARARPSSLCRRQSAFRCCIFMLAFLRLQSGRTCALRPHVGSSVSGRWLVAGLQNAI